MTIVTSFVGLCLLLFVGHFLREHIRLLRKLYLPSCVIAGILGLIIMQGVAYLGGLESDSMPVWTGKAIATVAGALPEWTAGWSKLPGFLINIVFACLFLGVTIPKFRVVAKRAGPQLAYGQVVAWGQYVVGIGLFIFVIQRFTDLPAMFGAIMPVGFEGGHGTAAGMESVFDKFNWSAGKDFALVSATAGITSAIIVGMILINWAERKGYVTKRAKIEDQLEDDTIAVIPVDRRPSAGKLTVSADAIESFTLHVAIVGLAILIGYLLKQGMLLMADAIGNETFGEIAGGFPLFPLCMIGGLVVQLCEDHFDKHKVIDLGLMRRIQNTSLDFLVVAAISSINIYALKEGLWPFLIIVAAGIVWNVLCVVLLARHVLPDAWFERSIAEMGQSMGITATGLLLLRVVDPDYETPAADAFASKQLLHEPFMGGGLWTSAAVPLLAVHGGPLVFYIALGAMAIWLVVLAIMRYYRIKASAV